MKQRPCLPGHGSHGGAAGDAGSGPEAQAISLRADWVWTQDSPKTWLQPTWQLGSRFKAGCGHWALSASHLLGTWPGLRGHTRVRLRACSEGHRLPSALKLTLVAGPPVRTARPGGCPLLCLRAPARLTHSGERPAPHGGAAGAVACCPGLTPHQPATRGPQAPGEGWCLQSEPPAALSACQCPRPGRGPAGWLCPRGMEGRGSAPGKAGGC